MLGDIPELQKYQLSEEDKALFVLVFLLGETDKNSLTKAVQQLSTHKEARGLKLRSFSVNNALKRLFDHKVLNLTDDGRKKDFFIHAITLSVAGQRAVFQHPLLPTFKQVIRQCFPNRYFSGNLHLGRRYYSCHDGEKFVCELHELLLIQSSAGQRQSFTFKPSISYTRSLKKHFEQYADSILRDVDSVEPSGLIIALPLLLEVALLQGLSIKKLTGVVSEFVGQQEQMEATDVFQVCALALWAGSSELLRKIAPYRKSKSWLAHAVDFVEAVLVGNWAEADKLIDRILSGCRKEFNDDGVSGCGNFFLVALLVAIRVSRSATRVRRLVYMFGEQSNYGSYLGGLGLDLTTLESANHSSASPIADKQSLPKDITFASACVSMIEGLFFAKSLLHKSVVQRGVEYLQAADELGMHLLSAWMLPAVEYICDETPEKERVLAQIRKSNKLPPLWAESSVVQPWQYALAQIKKLLPASGNGLYGDSAGAGRSSQLVWLLFLEEYDSGEISIRRIEVLVQKRLKSGKWSGGRRTELDALGDDSYAVHMDDNDKVVMSAYARLYRSFNGYYYGGVNYNMLAPALVGHPRVWAEEYRSRYGSNSNGRTQVKLERSEPVLKVESDAQQAVITPGWRFSKDDDKVLISRKSETELLVLEKEKLHWEIELLVNVYGKKGKLTIPREGLEEFKSLVPALSSVLPISGEFDAQFVDAREIEGGVFLRMRVRPLGDDVIGFELKNQPTAECDVVVAPGYGASTLMSQTAGEQVVIKRDLAAERGARQELQEACLALTEWEVGECCWEVGDFEAVLTILSDLNAMGEKVTLEWPDSEPLTVMRPDGMQPFNITANYGSDHWLSIGGNVQLDNGKVILFSELLQRVRDRKGSFVQLSENQYLRLTTSLMRKIELMARLGESSKKGVSLPPSSVALLSGMEDGKDGFSFPEVVRDRIADFRRVFKQSAELPASMTCELRPYQQEGFQWLVKLAACGLGACLADDMGLGKTIQILALLTHTAQQGASLVIAPTSVGQNWVDEAGRFAPALRFIKLNEAEDRQQAITAAEPFDVIITSYGLLPFEGEALESREWNVMVLDEAQAVKNRLAKRARAVKAIRSRARVIATGTPVENNLGDLWSLFDFLNPGLLGTHTQFERRFGDSSGIVKPALKKMTAPFILRRLKSTVLDELPPKTEIKLTVTLDSDERALYESCRQRALAELEAGGDETSRIAILAHLTRLRRVCCHPSLVVPGCTMAGQKLEAFIELMTELRAAGHRALVFSQFVEFLSIVRARLDQEKFTYQYLDGSTPAARRAMAVKDFQQGEGELFLISLKAGGTGLNLTAASYVILLDPWWNPAVEMQAADRAHRIGQRNPVTVYRLITAETVEERVLDLHAKKLAMAQSILEDTSDTRLTANDLLALFKK